MISEKVCDWLMDNADAPIRYRVASELLHRLVDLGRRPRRPFRIPRRCVIHQTHILQC